MQSDTLVWCKRQIKYCLTQLGERVSPGALSGLDATLNYLKLGQWMRSKGYHVRRRLAVREQLFDMVGELVGEKDVLYLEFGVFDGKATRHWSKLLHNASSKLHGFDSFEGLPEDWLLHRPKGHFSLAGQTPKIDDPRVQFFVGWFEETLPKYQCPPHDVMVLILDADLYSSTIFVLDALRDAITPGTYIYFDEFNHQAHELRAFDEFTTKTGMKFALLGASRSLEHVMFQRVA